MRYVLFILLTTLSLFANEKDIGLVKKAYANGLQPVPSNFEALLSTLGTTSKELSKSKIALGKKLFFEKELSLNKDISCASCHSFDKGGADGIPTAIGHKDRKNPFHLNSPTVLNTAFSKNFFWNGSSKTLQDQAKGPLQATFEMSITPKEAEKRIKENKEYKKMFTNVYGSGIITFGKIVDAIAAYEKTIVTKGRYDDYLLGNFKALSLKEKKGLQLFIDKGCVGCHNGIALGGQTLRKFPLTYHNIWSISKPKKIKKLQINYEEALKKLEHSHFKDESKKLSYLKTILGKKDFQLLQNGFFNQFDTTILTSTGCNECHQDGSNSVKKDLLKEVAYPFENKGGFLGAKEKVKYFRVPLLRNIVQTKPYFHNGSVEKLENAIKLMGTHQSRVTLSDNEIATIVAFLKAVDGEIIDYIK